MEGKMPALSARGDCIRYGLESRLTPSSTSGIATLDFQGVFVPASDKDLPVRLLLPGTNWLRVTPGLGRTPARK